MYIFILKLTLFLLALGYCKYFVSKYIFKEDSVLLKEKFNRHGPFYKMKWPEK